MKQIYAKTLNDHHPKGLEKLVLEQLVLPTTECSQAITDYGFKDLSENAIHIVYTEYDRDLSLDVIADRLHYNLNCLSNAFKEETGEKLDDSIQNRRLEVAKKWLKETNLSVKKITERLQYRSPQNFIRFFKKKGSVMPGEYRKKYLRTKRLFFLWTDSSNKGSWDNPSIYARG